MIAFLAIGLSPFFTPGPGPLLIHTAHLVQFWAALQRKVTSSSQEETVAQNNSLLSSLQIWSRKLGHGPHLICLPFTSINPPTAPSRQCCPPTRPYRPPRHTQEHAAHVSCVMLWKSILACCSRCLWIFEPLTEEHQERAMMQRARWMSHQIQWGSQLSVVQLRHLISLARP